MADENPEPTPDATDIHQRESAPLWFLIFTIIIAIWAAYYVVVNWGGPGPGVGY